MKFQIKDYQATIGALVMLVVILALLLGAEHWGWTQNPW